MNQVAVPPILQPPKAMRKLHIVYSFSLSSLLITIVIVLFVATFIVQAFQIPSESMENTLLVGDYLLVDKLCYGGSGDSFLMPYKAVKRGDIIVFKYPVDPTQHFVKRVIALEGDRIRLIDRRVYVNGSPVREPYVRYISTLPDDFRDNFPRMNIPEAGLDGDWWQQMKRYVQNGELIVPKGSYFVMGDNRDDSQDSRYWGFVPRANIVGRPLIIYWSMRSEEDEATVSETASDKLYRFAYAVTHIFQITRWDRTFRIVK